MKYIIDNCKVINIDIQIIASFIYIWKTSSHEAAKNVEKILKLMLKEHIVLHYGRLREEIKGSMTVDYIIKNTLNVDKSRNQIIEEEKTAFSKLKEIKLEEEDTGFMKVIDEDKQWKSDKSMRLKTPEPLEKTADEYQSRIKKSMTIKDHNVHVKRITKILHKMKIQGLMASGDHNIFPITMKSNSKFLEAKDYVEIGIRFCILEDKELIQLITFLFYDEFKISTMNLYPMYIYKLLVYYEKISLFEALYEKEKLYDRSVNSMILHECFSYSVILNNISIAVYFLRKYKRQLLPKCGSIIDSIIYLLNEYTEQNGAAKYKNGVLHIEELLYFIDIFLEGITYTQANLFIRVSINLIELKHLDGEE